MIIIGFHLQKHSYASYNISHDNIGDIHYSTIKFSQHIKLAQGAWVDSLLDTYLWEALGEIAPLVLTPMMIYVIM